MKIFILGFLLSTQAFGVGCGIFTANILIKGDTWEEMLENISQNYDQPRPNDTRQKKGFILGHVFANGTNRSFADYQNLSYLSVKLEPAKRGQDGKEVVDLHVTVLPFGRAEDDQEFTEFKFRRAEQMTKTILERAENWMVFRNISRLGPPKFNANGSRVVPHAEFVMTSQLDSFERDYFFFFKNFLTHIVGDFLNGYEEIDGREIHADIIH